MEDNEIIVSEPVELEENVVTGDEENPTETLEDEDPAHPGKKT